MTRVLIETVVRNTLKQIKIDPERSMRNVVDMALHLSGGSFRKELFQVAQTMLEQESSAYYKLIPDIVAHVESERIVQFGMNVGFNSFTVGAEQIRAIEWEENFNIPWCISLKLSDSVPDERYDAVINQGEELGIYSWLLFGTGDLSKLLTLPSKHPDSAFFLFCSPNDISEDWIKEAAQLNNLMFVVKFEGKAAITCSLLREMGLLYSLYMSYSESDVHNILTDDLLIETQELNPLMTVVLADTSCSNTARDKVYNYILQTRSKQHFLTIPWELEYDNRWVDGIISHEGCVAAFDEHGQLEGSPRLNLFEQGLRSILRRAFPKGGRR